MYKPQMYRTNTADALACHDTLFVAERDRYRTILRTSFRISVNRRCRRACFCAFKRRKNGVRTDIPDAENICRRRDI